MGRFGTQLACVAIIVLASTALAAPLSAQEQYFHPVELGHDHDKSFELSKFELLRFRVDHRGVFGDKAREPGFGEAPERFEDALLNDNREIEVLSAEFPLHGDPGDELVLTGYAALFESDAQITRALILGLKYQYAFWGLQTGVSMVTTLSVLNDVTLPTQFFAPDDTTARFVTPTVGFRLGALNATMLTFRADFHQLDMVGDDTPTPSFFKNVNLELFAYHPINPEFRLKVGTRFRALDFGDDDSRGLTLRSNLAQGALEYSYVTASGTRIVPVSLGVAVITYWDRLTPDGDLVYDYTGDNVIDGDDRALHPPRSGSAFLVTLEVSLGWGGFASVW